MKVGDRVLMYAVRLSTGRLLQTWNPLRKGLITKPYLGEGGWDWCCVEFGFPYEWSMCEEDMKLVIPQMYFQFSKEHV